MKLVIASLTLMAAGLAGVGLGGGGSAEHKGSS